MRTKFKLGTYVLGYKLMRGIGAPKLLPLNLTVSVTFKCNAKCKTCYIWEKYQGNPELAKKELKTEEFEKIFKSLGKTPFWITLSGGEPFIRKDLVEICESIYRNNEPKIINIPTNGILSKKIEKDTSAILEICEKTNIVVNLSLDGVGERHDEIRGYKGNFEKAMDTYERLHALKNEFKNLTVGVHSVISVFNINDLEEIYDFVKNNLKPDSYITEIAEERVELGTIGSGVTPNGEEYEKTINFVEEKIRDDFSSGGRFPKVVQAFRLNYYELVKRVLKERRQVIPCYAGWASGHVAANGDVWFCCIKADTIGNLRDVNYDFKRVWFSEKANEIRESIKKGECYCPMANVSYTNMLCDFKTLFKVGAKVIL